MITITENFSGFQKADDTAQWQIVFKIVIDGKELDYCRETRAGSIPLADIRLWASNQCHLQKLSGAEIQRWGGSKS